MPPRFRGGATYRRTCSRSAGQVRSTACPPQSRQADRCKQKDACDQTRHADRRGGRRNRWVGLSKSHGGVRWVQDPELNKDGRPAENSTPSDPDLNRSAQPPFHRLFLVPAVPITLLTLAAVGLDVPLTQ